MTKADRTAAYLFGMFFEELAKHSDLPGMREIAKKIYEESLEFDIEDSDMECEKALVKLDLNTPPTRKNYWVQPMMEECD